VRNLLCSWKELMRIGASMYCRQMAYSIAADLSPTASASWGCLVSASEHGVKQEF
jgi:hypothetical protein